MKAQNKYLKFDLSGKDTIMRNFIARAVQLITLDENGEWRRIYNDAFYSTCRSTNIDG